MRRAAEETVDVVVVGAVVGPQHRAAIQRDARTAWRQIIDQVPQIGALLRDVPAATQRPYDQVRVGKDYSYWKAGFWSPGMVLVGDAACFVDPVLSFGVHLATYGALLAARSVNSCLEATLDGRNPLFESTVIRDTFAEGGRLQEQALYGGPLDEIPPLPDGCTVPAEDGLAWAVASRP